MIGDRQIKCKFAEWVRQTIGKIVNVTKTLSEFEWQNPTDKGVIPKVEFDAKQMLKQVLISAGIKRWTHAMDRNNCCTTKAALVRTRPVNEVLDGYALGNGYIVRWCCHREPDVLATQVLIIASKRN